MNTTAKSIVKNIGKGFQKHWPKIATAFGGVLLVTAGYLAGREVPKYKEELERKREENCRGKRERTTACGDRVREERRLIRTDRRKILAEDGCRDHGRGSAGSSGEDSPTGGNGKERFNLKEQGK